MVYIYKYQHLPTIPAQSSNATQDVVQQPALKWIIELHGVGTRLRPWKPALWYQQQQQQEGERTFRREEQQQDKQENRIRAGL
jgi:hypothetical protein